MVKRDARGKRGKLLCCKRIFERIKANLAEIQPKNQQNVQKTHFSQKAPGVNGLSTRAFVTRTVTGSELFSLLTCPHTTAFTMLSIFSPLQTGTSKIWHVADNTFLASEMFSSGCRPRLENECA